MKLDRLLLPLLISEQGYRLAQGLVAAFLLLAILNLSSVFSTWNADMKLASETQAKAAAAKAVSASLGELAQILPAAHLFGSAPKAADYVPITNLQMRLTGILQDSTDEQGNSFSKAIISLQGGVGKVFQVGDQVMDGIKITEINADSVILENNGHSERLPILRQRLGGK